MPKKTYSKTGSLTRAEARKAILGVKRTRAATKKADAKVTSPRNYERYLGHFGFVLESPENTRHGAAKRGAARKKSATKKTSSAARKHRRAG